MMAKELKRPIKDNDDQLANPLTKSNEAKIDSNAERKSLSTDILHGKNENSQNLQGERFRIVKRTDKMNFGSEKRIDDRSQELFQYDSLKDKKFK